MPPPPAVAVLPAPDTCRLPLVLGEVPWPRNLLVYPRHAPPSGQSRLQVTPRGRDRRLLV